MTGNNFPEEFQRIWKYSHGSLPKEEFDQAKKEAQIVLKNCILML